MAWLASWLIVLAFAGGDLPATKGLHRLQAEIPGAGRVLYAVSVPDGYDPRTPSPLVLVLHPGGPRGAYYGAEFLRRIALPGLRQLQPIMIAPDCTERAWADAPCDTAAMTLIGDAMKSYNIDRKRVLVVGFSMGGRGTWHMAANHPDVFTAAIPMAASTRGITVDSLGRQPTYVIDSRMDEVVAFEPAEDNVQELRKLKRDVEFEAIDDLTHFDMISYVDSLQRAARWVAGRWKR